MDKQILIDLVIDQIVTDIENGDATALSEMLAFLDNEVLQSYLSEVK
jgi:hypothetical protein